VTARDVDSISPPHRLHGSSAREEFYGRMSSIQKELTMNMKHILIAATAGIAVLALAGAALAAGPRAATPRAAALHQTHGVGYGVMAGGVVMDAAAEYIGISETALATARHSGKSLAQIAVDHGKTVAGLEQALVAAFKANLDKAVSAGRITSAQATQALANFRAHVATAINRTATGPMRGRGAGMGMGLGRGSGQGMGLGLGVCGGRR